MIKRIADMIAYSRDHDIRPEITKVQYDPMDLCHPEIITNALQLREYILGQKVKLNPNMRFTGGITFDGSTPADIFQRTGHRAFAKLVEELYLKVRDNLVCFEWQHCVADYDRLLKRGITGLMDTIEASVKKYAGMQEEQDFLEALRIVCQTVIDWGEKCACECEKQAAEEDDSARREDLMHIADMCRHSPAKPARTFREAIQAVYICFCFLPDSFGTIDRYLHDFYFADIESGILTREEAKEYLQEFFTMVDGWVPYFGKNANRGGESHFAIGGYTLDAKDGYDDLSELVLESLMEMPTIRPQISIRWTPEMPFEKFKKVLDCERKDKYKRIALVNDVPRVRGFMENAGLSWEEAINYSTCGCNEPALQGSIWFGGCSANIVRCLETVLYKKKEQVLACNDFESFYQLLENEMIMDLNRIIDYTDSFNRARANDNSLLSCILLHGCAENGKSVTRGGCSAVCGPTLQGTVCLVDSLTVIKQFVFDEKTVSMEKLLEVLEKNWQGEEILRQRILKTAKFFGNDEEISNKMMQRVTTSFHKFTQSRKALFDTPILMGTMAGYNAHYAWYGYRTKATPDGRYSGDAYMVGIGQTAGKDREGLTALLNSVAQADPTAICVGPYVCNINLDPALIKDDDQFDRTAHMIEAYFRKGGIQLQLNYVDPSELINAQNDPDSYKSLRVRVSGFSANFVLLPEEIQDDIIRRTQFH